MKKTMKKWVYSKIDFEKVIQIYFEMKYSNGELVMDHAGVKPTSDEFGLFLRFSVFFLFQNFNFSLQNFNFIFPNFTFKFTHFTFNFTNFNFSFTNSKFFTL